MIGDRPVLLLDIDGVLNPFAAAHCPAGYTEYDLFPGEEPVRLCRSHGEWIAELTGPFEVIWASAWGRSANLLLGRRGIARSAARPNVSADSPVARSA